jgi:RNA polymerase sigma factor (sigma-70 family)
MVERTEHRPTSPIGADEAEFIKAARADDTSRFALLTERFRRELLAHCYRMLASYEDAQDMTQETFLRAWAGRECFQGRASLRTWLYRIATDACLDFLEKRRDRTPIPTDMQGAGGTGTEVLYLQPWPDIQPDDPHERMVARETIELAFTFWSMPSCVRRRPDCRVPRPASVIGCAVLLTVPSSTCRRGSGRS